ncbi:MAG: ComF family protein [Clostridia bacterium]|nr:ComF family protein [Clostridia bacterium]
MDLGKALGSFLRRIEDLVYPRGINCLVCGDRRRTDPATCVCPGCLKKLEDERVPAAACPRCLSYASRKGCAFCAAGGMKDVRRAFAPLYYLPASRALVISLKFGGTDEALPLLGEWMEVSLAERDFDCILPVPLHPRRRRERGVNQAALLASEVSRRTGIPLREDLLVRKKYTRPQTAVGRRKRKSNVLDAFAVPSGPDVSGMKILLCDDVRTTGNTAQACARALKKAGAADVCLLTACAVR